MCSKYHVCAGMFWVSGTCRGRGFCVAAGLYREHCAVEGLYREHCAAEGPTLCHGKGPRLPILCSVYPSLRCFDLGVSLVLQLCIRARLTDSGEGPHVQRSVAQLGSVVGR